jgi:ElaB/YqjD/DUF883 family membrane-anchored ribosome-binding protein
LQPEIGKSEMPSRTQSDLEAIAGDVSSLKRALARLMDHVKNGSYDAAKGSTVDEVERLSKDADRVYRTLSKRGERSVNAITQRVERQPLTSVLIAFGVGLISGRWLSR